MLTGAIALGTLAVQHANAGSFNWDPTGSNGTNGGGVGVWDTSSPFWFNGSTDVPWINNSPSSDEAIFGGASGGTVTLGANVEANALTFNTAGYVITGGNTITLSGTTPTVTVNAGASTIGSTIAGSAGITKAGAGTLVLSNTAANTFTGGINLIGGALRFNAGNQLGTGNAVNLSNGAVYSYAGNAQYTLPTALNVGAGGAVIDCATPGGNGSLNKLFIGTGGLGTNTLSGSGTITKTGPGYI